jgi:hypothetical protein
MSKLSRLGAVLWLVLSGACHHAPNDRCAVWRRQEAESRSGKTYPDAYLEFQVDRAVGFTTPDSVSPKPELGGEYHGPLLVGFVIDTTGKVIPETYKTRHVEDEALAADAQKAMPQWTFEAAMMNGCKVKQIELVEVTR